jgi:hypothetical protein
VIEPGRKQAFAFDLGRMSNSFDRAYRPLQLAVQIEYLGAGYRYPLPEQRFELPIVADIVAPPRPDAEHALLLDGRGDHVRVAPGDARVPDGPLTLECWFNAKAFGKRVGLVTKTEGSEFGIFVNEGKPTFSVHVGGSYANARVDKSVLQTNRWHHIAGVYDGRQVRLYVDGRLVASVARSGKRKMNGLPLMIGADVDRNGAAVSHFHGAIDEVRLSKRARYTGDRFAPQRRLEPDADTLLLLHMDGTVATWLYNAAPEGRHPTIAEDAYVGRAP